MDRRAIQRMIGVADVLGVFTVAPGLGARPAVAHPAAVGGTSTLSDKEIPDLFPFLDQWVDLLSLPFVFAVDHRHWCAVTASADVELTEFGLQDSLYRFAVSLDGSRRSSCERTLEFDDNLGVDDAVHKTVSTTCTFNNIPAGDHIFRFVARRVDAADADATVRDSSMSVVCSRTQL